MIDFKNLLTIKLLENDDYGEKSTVILIDKEDFETLKEHLENCRDNDEYEENINGFLYYLKENNFIKFREIDCDGDWSLSVC